MEVNERELADVQVEESQTQTEVKNDVIDAETDGDEGKSPSKKDEEKAEKPDFKKLSTRETIKHALKEEKDKEQKDEKSKKPRKADTDSNESDISGQEKNTEAEKEPYSSVSKPIDKELQGSKPPPGWTKEAKSKWDTLDPDIRKSVLKREKEVSDGFAKYGKDTEELKQINEVFAPRENELKTLGVSKAQLVSRMLQWTDALSSPNKVNHWLELGRNYGITDDVLRQYYTQGTQTPQNNTPVNQQTNQNQSDPEVAALKQQVTQFMNNITAQQQQEANAALDNWAKDKPHYQKVRPIMTALFNSGALQLKGLADLDTAYERACNADPEIRAQLDAERLAEHDRQQKLEAEKKEKERLARLQKARNANSSIKSGAPNSPQSGKQAAPRKNISVAESLRMALEEIRAGD